MVKAVRQSYHRQRQCVEKEMEAAMATARLDRLLEIERSMMKQIS
jgi:hypothetical protein